MHHVQVSFRDTTIFGFQLDFSNHTRCIMSKYLFVTLQFSDSNYIDFSNHMRCIIYKYFNTSASSFQPSCRLTCSTTFIKSKLEKNITGTNVFTCVSRYGVLAFPNADWTTVDCFVCTSFSCGD